jgi:hypothetical protein
MWIANSEDNTVTELSPTGATLGTFPVVSASGIAFDGTNMWVTSPQTNTVTEL